MNLKNINTHRNLLFSKLVWAISYRLKPIEHKSKPEQVNLFRDFSRKFFPKKQFAFTPTATEKFANVDSVRITAHWT